MTNLAMAPFFVLGPGVAVRSLDGAESWGLIGSCAAAGSLLGDLVALRVHPRRPLATGYFLSASAAVAPLLLAAPASAPAIAAAAGPDSPRWDSRTPCGSRRSSSTCPRTRCRG